MLLLSLDPKSGRILIESSSLHENCFKSIHTYSRVLLICETINFGKRMFCQMVQIKFGCWLRLWFAKISCTMLRRTLDAIIQNFALKLFEMDFTYQLRWKDKSQNHHLKSKFIATAHNEHFAFGAAIIIFIFQAIFFGLDCAWSLVSPIQCVRVFVATVSYVKLHWAERKQNSCWHDIN